MFVVTEVIIIIFRMRKRYKIET